MPVRRLGFVSATVLATTMMSACEQPRPIPPGTDRYYYGHLLEGEKFGVSIGMNQEEAVRILTARGLRDDGLWGCGDYSAQVTGCDAHDQIYLFRQRRFGRDGTVFLKIVDDQVDFISWSFVIIFIDF